MKEYFYELYQNWIIDSNNRANNKKLWELFNQTFPREKLCNCGNKMAKLTTKLRQHFGPKNNSENG